MLPLATPSFHIQFPVVSGYVNDTETLEEAVVREVKEETGQNVNIFQAIF